MSTAHLAWLCTSMMMLLILLLNHGRGSKNEWMSCVMLAVILSSYLLVGQTSDPVFVEEPGSNITVEINTTISLLWRIHWYEGCNNEGCLQVSLYTSNNHELYDSVYPIERNHGILKNLLFYANTTLISTGPTNTANVHIIMYINEFVRNNVPFIHCKVRVSRDEQTLKAETTVYITVTDLPTTAVPTTQLSPTSTSKPPVCIQQLVCNSAHVVCSSEPCLGLLCFIQLLYYVIASYCS